MSLRSLVLLASAALLGLQFLATPASAGQRVALVIGNASYAHALVAGEPPQRRDRHRRRPGAPRLRGHAAG